MRARLAQFSIRAHVKTAVSLPQILVVEFVPKDMQAVLTQGLMMKLAARQFFHPSDI